VYDSVEIDERKRPGGRGCVPPTPVKEQPHRPGA
jgi:hypothetical protein